MKTRLLPAALVALSCACSSTPKSDRVELSELEGKRVAVLEIDGEATAKRITEVALINQLMKHGSFELINKKELEKIRTDHDLDPRDSLEIAKRAGADYALGVKVEEFSAKENQGYSRESKYDSQLAKERGEKDAMSDRLYKVKSLTGQVRYHVEFTNAADGSIKKGIAEAKDIVVADEKDKAIHLPPKLRFLESLSMKAFEKFFEEHH